MARVDMILIRGLPSSGKSTFAARFRGLGGCHYEADDYFRGEFGGYEFDPSKLSEAHSECQIDAKECLMNKLDVIVANTFSQRWELEPYFLLAEKYTTKGHSLPCRDRLYVDVFVLDLFDGGLTDDELAARNTHGVPVDVIAAMRERWEHDWRSGNPIPPWERS